MNEEYYYAIIPATFLLMMIGFGIALLFGKGGILIPGYNIKAKGEEAKEYEKYYCKRIGVFVLILAIFFIVVFAGILFKIYVLAGVAGGLGSLCAIMGCIALKNNVKLQKAVIIAKELTKRYEEENANEKEDNRKK